LTQLAAETLLELWDHAPALVFVADRQMRYLAVNATACDTLGYSREELLSLRVTDLAVADDVEHLYGAMLATGEQVGWTPLRAKDGTTFGCHYHARACTIAGVEYYVAVGFVDPVSA
jgi:PAS domain S-box-containing protein